MERVLEIMIIEDHLLTQDMLKAVFDSVSCYRVVATVDSAEKALELLDSICPDLIILDIGLPGISGDKAIGFIMKKCPTAEVLVYTASDEDEKVFTCLKAGASGYILKNTKPNDILSAVEELTNGGAPMSPQIAKKVLKEFKALAGRDHKDQPMELLSPREEEILKLLYEGATYKEISDALSISIHTVHTHIKRIYHKLHVNSRSQAIFEAIKRHLI